MMCGKGKPRHVVAGAELNNSAQYNTTARALEQAELDDFGYEVSMQTDGIAPAPLASAVIRKLQPELVILDLLKMGATLSYEAVYKQLGITNLYQIVYRLRFQGYPIDLLDSGFRMGVM